MRNTKYIPTHWLWSLLLLLAACSNNTTEPQTINTQHINTNWQFRQAGSPQWYSATVPGTVHTDLLSNKRIEDPFYRTNEKSQQWIDKEDWEYKTTFQVDKTTATKSHILLHFKGLDTYADVYLNDSLLLQAQNMFRSWEIDVKKHLRQGDNDLRIYFHSPIRKGLKLLEAHGYPLPAINDQSENGGVGKQKVSVFTRKAGYHYGWDWGPRFVTSGIWRPILLKSYNYGRITDVFVQQNNITATLAEIDFRTKIETDKKYEIEIQVHDKTTGTLLVSQKNQTQVGENIVSLPVRIENPKLWWSRGLGEPHLYNFEVTLLAEGKQIDQYTLQTGLRSLRIVQEPDSLGKSFYVELNNRPVFAKGANYIPNDNFLPRVTKSNYERVIKNAVDANMNMLRVWGGGIYENDEFYNLCDQNGLLVWQDFMFACSMYPGDSTFLKNVQAEAKENIIRLRNHPSIALWCGNNEIDAAWSHDDKNGWGWKEKYTDQQREDIFKNYTTIFHKILPEAIAQYSNNTYYWPSSPMGGEELNNHSSYTSTSGDIHYWGVWHGKEPFENFRTKIGRFMSEYGFQSFPDFETVKRYTNSTDWDIESEVMTAHQRSGIGNLRIKEYLSWYYQAPKDFESFLYLSQVQQAYAIKIATEAHRIKMPYTMGTLYWQINDCWPVASWSSTDYLGKWKAQHYAMRKTYADLAVFTQINDQVTHLQVVSDLREEKNLQLKWRLIDFKGKVVLEGTKALKIAGNTSTLVEQFDNTVVKNKNNSLLHISLQENNQVVFDNFHYFVKPKDLALQKPTITTVVNKVGNKWEVTLKSNVLAKDVCLSVPDKAVVFSDNYFDLLPMEELKITCDTEDEVKDLGSLIRIRSLWDSYL